ncbi:hypothetical protein [Nonomuraea sp. NPDC049684]|uniref:hypothetical protein n=1 Tax=Nonomuraea sp. NPDC049684 TaxID=3364356 RepID=UPI0037A235AC
MTLLLAVRRHRHQELATAHTAHTAHTTHTTHDAAERRVTELYTKAADHLGSDKAHRSGSLAFTPWSAWPRTPPLRQTIVNVICSYLRMPCTPPPEGADPAGPAVPRAAVGGISAPATGRDPQEERQVRLTAQRILAAHLRHDGFADYLRQSSGSPRCPRSPGRT